MEVKIYRAKTMQEALGLVQSELGPQATVLNTREVVPGRLSRLIGRRGYIEVTASATVSVPSRFPQDGEADDALPVSPDPERTQSYREKYRTEVQQQLSDLHSMVEQLCIQGHGAKHSELPESLFHLFTELIDADVDECDARELIERVRKEVRDDELGDPLLVKARIARMIEDEIHVTGPINPASGSRRVVALVGPTGVGKTTTIAKLAANYRLREKRQVGLITVDTYRIAAVEQLRTYADIIDLPMEVVSTPRQMREAVARLSNLDLVLIDTAGRSPRDQVRIQELRAMLNEAQADEVLLVLSAVASSGGLQKTAQQFATVGTTSMILTKIDEATGLGNLLPVVRNVNLPVSYLTNGQNVPDDIEPAERRRLARYILQLED